MSQKCGVLKNGCRGDRNGVLWTSRLLSVRMVEFCYIIPTYTQQSVRACVRLYMCLYICVHVREVGCSSVVEHPFMMHGVSRIDASWGPTELFLFLVPTCVLHLM